MIVGRLFTDFVSEILQIFCKLSADICRIFCQHYAVIFADFFSGISDISQVDSYMKFAMDVACALLVFASRCLHAEDLLHLSKVPKGDCKK